MRAWLNPVLPWTDYFFCNNDEAERITGQSGAIEQAKALKELGVKTAIVTQGAQGAILVGDAMKLRSGVYPVQPVDGTGTGDAFASGFLYGLLRGKDLRECLKLGTAMGASCVQSMGATTGVFREQELLDHVRTNTLHVESF